MGRRPNLRGDVHPAPVAVQLSVRLSDGSFESQVSVPVSASDADKNKAVMRWLEIVQFGLKLPGAVEIVNEIEVSP